MYPVPVTYLYQFEGCTESQRRGAMHEFASNGAKHLVLTDSLIGDIIKNHALIDILPKEMAEEGLTFVDSHAMFHMDLDLNCPNQAKRRMMIARLKLQLEIIAYMGIDTITIHTGNNLQYDPQEKVLEFNFNMIRDALEQLLPVAEELGVVINIENIWYPNNTPEKLLAFKELFPTDALGFCYDAGHANIMWNGRFHMDGNARNVWSKINMTPSWDNQILEKMLPNVVTCHIHDNMGKTDEHTNPGRGNTDIPHVVELLKQAPRLKSIQSEVIPFRSNSSVREICDVFQQLFPEAKDL